MDIHELVAIFARRRILFISIFTVLTALVLLIVISTRPTYTAVSSVLVDQRAPSLLKADPDGRPDNAALDTGRVDTQVEILKSHDFADRVVDQLGLQADPEFNGSLRPPSPIKRVMGQVFRVRDKLKGGGPPVASAGTDRIDRQGAPDELEGHIKVTRVGVTYVLNISVTASSALKAKQIANAFANQYLKYQVDIQSAANRIRNASLISRLNELRGQVQAAETAVQQYKIVHNLLSAQGQTLTEQEVATLDQQLAMARAQETEAEARASTAKSQLARGSTGEDVGEALNSPVVQQLRQQRAVASQKVAVLSSRYGDRLPSMISARRDLADVDAQIQAEIKRVISNLDAQAQVAKQRADSIAESLSRSRQNLVSNNESSVGLDELQRNLDSLRGLYETLLNRYKETNAEQGLEQPEAKIVTFAELPAGPSGPKKGLGAVLALLAGLVGGTAAVVIVEVLDRTVWTEDKLSRGLGVPCLGSLPILKSTLRRSEKGHEADAPLDYLLSRPRSSFAEAFRDFRTSLLSSGLGRSGCVLAITSALPEEGKSTAALCLSRTYVLAGASVVVVDFNVKRVSYAHSQPMATTTEIVEMPWGEPELEQSLLRDDTSGAWMLTLSTTPDREVDNLNSEAIGGMVSQLRARFDLVILDCGSVLALSDTRALAARADAAVLLVRWRKTPLNAARRALAMLHSAHAPVIGTVLTFVDMKQQARTGYGDSAYFLKPSRLFS